MLSFLHRAMLIGQLVFLAGILFLIYSKTILPNLADQVKILQVIALLFSGASILASVKLFKRKLALISEDGNANAEQKMLNYRSAVMLQWGFAELPTLVCGICLLLSGNYAFLALAVVIIIYFAMLMPVKNRVAAQLNLQSSDLDKL